MYLRWTASKAEDALLCLLKYTFAQRIKVDTPSAIAFGNFIHTQASKFYQRFPRYKKAASYGGNLKGIWMMLTQGGRYRGKDLRYIGKPLNWGADPTLPEEERMKYINVERAKYGNWAKRMGIFMYERYAPQPPPPGIETKFELHLKDKDFGPIHFRGRFDRIEIHPQEPRPIVSVDLKTGVHQPRSMELEFEVSSTIYTLMLADAILQQGPNLAARWKFDPMLINGAWKNQDLEQAMALTEARFLFLRNDETIVTQRSMHHVKDLLIQLAEKEDAILRNAIVPSRGPHCNWCHYRVPCLQLTQQNRIEQFTQSQATLFDQPKQEKELQPVVTQLAFDFLHEKKPRKRRSHRTETPLIPQSAPGASK